MKKIIGIYMGYTFAGIAFGILFQLKPVFLLILIFGGFFFLPKIIANARKIKSEQARFFDINVYMEQLLYSFRKTKKILTSLEDIQIQFQNSPVYDLIEQAKKHILETYQSEEDVEQEALELIEEQYSCVKLKMIHRFLLKVENLGGDFDNTIELLLADRSMWEQRQTHLQHERRKKRNLVAASIGMSILLCLIFIRMLPADMDISQNPAVQFATLAMCFFDFGVYLKADKKLSEDWLCRNSVSEQESVRRYYKVKNYDRKKQVIKSLLYAVLAFLAGLLFYLMKIRWISLIFFVLTPIMFFQHKLDYALARKKLIRDVEQSFPEWLMEMSLLLQSDSVQVSLYRSFDNAPEVLKPELEIMYDKLKEDPTSITPYLEFMQEFEIRGIQSAMKMLYSISAGTGGSSDSQIMDMLRRNNAMLDDAEKKADEESMTSMYLLFGLPALAGGAKLLLDMAVFFFYSLQGMGTYM